MSLRDRLSLNDSNEEQNQTGQMPLQEEILPSTPAGVDFSSLKEQLNVLLVEKVNSTPVWINYTDSQQKALLKQFVEGQLSNSLNQVSLKKDEKEKLVKEIIEEAQGFGPLDPLLKDSEISYILVNGAKDVSVEKNGKLTKTNVTFKDNQHLKNMIERVIANAGKRIDEKTPMADAKLANGFHINAVLPPLALDGPVLSIKKTLLTVQSLSGLVKQRFLSKEMADFLSFAAKAKLNIVISGQTGAGKTTLLNALASEIPLNERIITIEDSAELMLQRENTIRFETRQASAAAPEISAKDLLSNAFRMRPDRIIIGQCKESETLLQAINGDIEGFLTTMLATSAQDTIDRLKADSAGSRKAIAALNLIIHVARLQDGSRKITSISEIVMQGNEPALNEVFTLNNNEHISTGIKPSLLAKFEHSGVSLPSEYFDKERKHVYTPEALAKTASKQEPALMKRLFKKS